MCLRLEGEAEKIKQKNVNNIFFWIFASINNLINLTKKCDFFTSCSFLLLRRNAGISANRTSLLRHRAPHRSKNGKEQTPISNNHLRPAATRLRTGFRDLFGDLFFFLHRPHKCCAQRPGTDLRHLLHHRRRQTEKTVAVAIAAIAVVAKTAIAVVIARPEEFATVEESCEEERLSPLLALSSKFCFVSVAVACCCPRCLTAKTLSVFAETSRCECCPRLIWVDVVVAAAGRIVVGA